MSLKVIFLLNIFVLSIECASLSTVPLTVIVNNTNEHTTNRDAIVKNIIGEISEVDPTARKNDAVFGQCRKEDQRVHTEEILIENDGKSILNGTFEFYINSPIVITCIKVLDNMPLGTGAEVSLHSGGPGYNWFFLSTKGKYGRGMHLSVMAYGIIDINKLKFSKIIKS